MELISVFSNLFLYGLLILFVVLLLSYVYSKTTNNDKHEENHDLIQKSPYSSEYYYNAPDQGRYDSDEYGSRPHPQNGGHRITSRKPIEQYISRGMKVTHITYGNELPYKNNGSGRMKPEERDPYYYRLSKERENRANYYPSEKQYYESPVREDPPRQYKTKPELRTKRYTIVNKPNIDWNNQSPPSSNSDNLMSTREFLKQSFR